MYLLKSTSLDRTPIYKSSIRLEENSKMVNTLADGPFNMMFQTEKTREFACYLFSKFLNVSFEQLKREMQLYKNVFSKEKLASRERTGDFVARFGNILLSFEMNNTNTLERNVEYVNKLYSEFANSKDLQEEVETIYVPVFQLNMNNFVFKGEKDTIKISYASNGKRMRVKIIFIDVYLPNIEKKYNRLGKESLTEQEKVALAMFAENEKTVKELIEGDDELMKFFKKRKELKTYDPLFQAFDHREDFIKAQFAAGKEEGLERGLERGLVTANEVNAKKMLQKKYTLEDIMDITGIPLERLNELKSALPIT